MTKPLDIESYEGSVSPQEVEFLNLHAAAVTAGVIVEIGSWRGKSAIALAAGAESIPEAQRPLVYCVDPHSPFLGVYGGRFGPHDRTHFYSAMLRSGYSSAVALINLPSADAARAFSQPIGLLFIDGDHTEQGVQRDVDSWLGHVLPGGTILFDDAIDPTIGPFKIIQNLLSSGKYTRASEAGKIVALRRSEQIVKQ